MSEAGNCRCGECCVLLEAFFTCSAMLSEGVPLGNTDKGGCTEISEVLRFKEGIVLRSCCS